jgi:RsiW-degrading membrane proteinase PrsW (M82 family)
MSKRFSQALLILIVVLLFSASLPALSQSPPVSDTVFSGRALDIQVSGTNFTFSSSQVNETISISVKNPTDTPLDVYIAMYKNGEWTVGDKLGTVAPRSTDVYALAEGFSYSGRTIEVDRMGVLGEASSIALGNEFFIRENWGTYEDYLKSSLSFFGVLSAGLLLGILLIIMAGVYSVAIHAKHQEEVEPGEYTFRTLFIPLTRMRPAAEKIADILISPFFWIVELILGSILVGLILLFALSDIRPDIGILVFIVGGVAAIFMPIVFLVMGWLADYYEREPFRFIAAMFMWGIFATSIAFFMNTTFSLLLGLILSSGAASLAIAVLVAPVVEETAKGMGLLIISGHHEFNGVFDGILYGFAIGMGFAAIENWLYFASNASPVAVGGLEGWTYNILYRSFLCSLAHGCFTAATGGMIGFFKSSKHLRGFAFVGFFAGLPIAILLHASFNFTAIIDSIMQTAFGVPVPIFDPLLTIVVTGIYICIGIYLQLKIKNSRKNAN